MSLDQHHISHQNEVWRVNANLALLEALLNYVDRPSKVVDVGCGYGYFLRACEEILQEVEVFGLDGPWVDHRFLQFSPDSFYTVDLISDSCWPRIEADLVVCLEVIEHLPPDRGLSFCEELVSFKSPILFSAAIPGQGGQGHVNERLPSFWMNEFKRLGFIPTDCLHPHIWVDNRLPFWFKQNPILIVPEEQQQRYPHHLKPTNFKLFDRIHPEMIYTNSRVVG